MDGLEDARNLLPGVRLDSAELLMGGERTEVRRVRARWPEGGATSVIVKRYVSSGEGWTREAAALVSVPDNAPAPRLVAEGGVPPVVVMSDLGPGRTVADALLGTSADEATAAVLEWAEAVADLHAATLGGRARFRAELALRAGDLPVADHVMPAVVDETALLLETRCAELGVAIPSGALREFRELPRTLRADAEAAALSPSDACPDDNVRTADGVVLVDFEGAQWRHVVWDVAYLTVPWASCWCAWRMPSDVVERAVEHYRARIESALPYVRTPQFRKDLAAATAGWAFISAAWLLPDASGTDRPATDRRKVTPARRAMILHRLDRARRNGDLERLARFAEILRAALVQRWGEVPLAYAPAFDAQS